MTRSGSSSTKWTASFSRRSWKPLSLVVAVWVRRYHSLSPRASRRIPISESAALTLTRSSRGRAVVRCFDARAVMCLLGVDKAHRNRSPFHIRDDLRDIAKICADRMSPDRSKGALFSILSRPARSESFTRSLKGLVFLSRSRRAATSLSSEIVMRIDQT